MIVDKLKEVQLVRESAALKIDAQERTFQRYDKTVYVEEPFSLPITGSGTAFVESQKFFALFNEAVRMEMDSDYVKMVLKNGAEYKLPKLAESTDGTFKYWETNKLTKSFNADNAINLKLALGRLTSATLKNLANPMLQCIYIDADTGVSCNSMIACIDGTTVSKEAILLPPDVVMLMEGKEAQLSIVGDSFIIKIAEAFILCPVPSFDYSETAAVLRDSLPHTIEKHPVGNLFEGIKRLSAFGDFISFDKDRVIAGENFEPFSFKSAEPTFRYGAQYLLTVLPQVSHIAQSEFALLLYGDKYLFMVSPESKD